MDPEFRNKEDSAGYFPDYDTALEYARNVSESAYHQDRLRALTYLTDKLKKEELHTVLDYGVGDGGEFLQLSLNPKKLIGIDISPHMIEISKTTIPSNIEYLPFVGSTETLRLVDSESIDLFLCINVIGYLSESEREDLFNQINRIIRKGGYFLVMTGNELFNLFALNSGTASFFARHFSQSESTIADLLSESRTSRIKNATSDNPIAFKHDLINYGFKEINQAFSQWHEIPPALANKKYANLREARAKARNHDVNPNVFPPHEKWKALFCCSIFASLSIKE